ncbi:hypothetical protein TNCT_95961 [Trichonephila clavata]|uniref:Uncharacterized protein n=1 Tax=Trichonephila clavata TaxID=2740835 RepID=A0A8X6G211_TRICU|nr:hypothetical protein TNCT_95961 [Trichonephila clavata]
MKPRELKRTFNISTSRYLPSRLFNISPPHFKRLPYHWPFVHFLKQTDLAEKGGNFLHMDRKLTSDRGQKLVRFPKSSKRKFRSSFEYG